MPANSPYPGESREDFKRRKLEDRVSTLRSGRTLKNAKTVEKFPSKSKLRKRLRAIRKDTKGLRGRLKTLKSGDRRPTEPQLAELTKIRERLAPLRELRQQNPGLFGKGKQGPKGRMPQFPRGGLKPVKGNRLDEVLRSESKLRKQKQGFRGV